MSISLLTGLDTNLLIGLLSAIIVLNCFLFVHFSRG